MLVSPPVIKGGHDLGERALVVREGGRGCVEAWMVIQLCRRRPLALPSGLGNPCWLLALLVHLSNSRIREAPDTRGCGLLQGEVRSTEQTRGEPNDATRRPARAKEQARGSSSRLPGPACNRGA